MNRKEKSRERITEVLRERNLKQVELAKMSNIHPAALSLYLSGKRSPNEEQAKKMADALGVDYLWLQGYDVPRKKTEESDAVLKRLYGAIDRMDDNQRIKLYDMITAFFR